MRTTCSQLILSLAFVCNSPLCGAQVPGTVQYQHKTSREALLERGIAVDPVYLKAALANPDAEIRGLAAMRLATDKVTGATPEIKTALTNETDPVASLRMAGSLFNLSPSDGKPFVVGLCQNTTMKREITIGAARTLVDLDPQGAQSACAPTLLYFVRDFKDPSHQAGALSVLTALHSQLSDASKSEFRSISLILLSKPDFLSRSAAVKALAADGSDQARGALSRAAQTESNPGFRDYINHFLTEAIHK